MVDDRAEQSVAIAEVVLNHSPAHACAVDDVAGARRGEALLADAADRLSITSARVRPRVPERGCFHPAPGGIQV